MDRILFRIGNIEIAWYSVLIAVGALIAISLVIKEGKRFGMQSDFIFNLCFWAIIFGIIGARLYYVLFNLEYYTNFWDIFKIWEGGLAIHGGLIFGFITVLIFCKKYDVKAIRIFDYAAPALLIAQAIGRWGNFFNSEAHGAATTLSHLQSLHIPEFIIKGMKIDGIYYEPTFFYESVLCLIGFILIMIIRRNKYIKEGQITAMYLIWYGVVRFFIEIKRTDALMLGGFKVAEIVSIIMVLIGLIIIFITSRKGHFEDLYNQQDNGNIKF